MQNLLQQRCFNHASREAVARCPECSRFFCRECITEHDDRAVCSACLKKLVQPPIARRRLLKVFRGAQFLAALLIAWFFFFAIGESLLRIPASFHEGTLWHAGWLDQK
ncbi:MAG TPA: rhomboid family protein [Candidatus Angelobacter sp.]|nr:rhomboid family protein [Candidatus Angelobacter sp.]